MDRSLSTQVMALWCALLGCTQNIPPNGSNESNRGSADPCALSVLGDLPCELDNVDECVQECQIQCGRDSVDWQDQKAVEELVDCEAHCYCSDECVECWQDCGDEDDDEDTQVRSTACQIDCYNRCGVCKTQIPDVSLACTGACNYDACDGLSDSECSLYDCDAICHRDYLETDRTCFNDCNEICLACLDCADSDCPMNCGSNDFDYCRNDCYIQCTHNDYLDDCYQQCGEDQACQLDCLLQYQRVALNECRAKACGEKCAECNANYTECYYAQ